MVKRVFTLLLLLLLPSQALAQQEIAVNSASTRLDGNVYFLSAVFDINLPYHITAAFEQGFELPLVMEVEVFKHRTFWLDDDVVTIRQQYQLQHHAMLDSVSVLNVNAGSRLYYSTLKQALSRLTFVLDYPLLDNNALKPAESYNARIHFGIDMAELPVPLKSSSFWKNNWNIMSDWYEWNINP